MTKLVLKKPYAIFLGKVQNPLDAKTGFGLVDWCPDDCIAQTRLSGCKVDLNLPERTPAQAASAGAKSFVIGVAPTGGELNPAWRESLIEALRSDLDLISGLHFRLEDDEMIGHVASQENARIINLRSPPKLLHVASGKPRSGCRLLTVGTDCCVGKKYTALAIYRAMQRQKIASTFRATGQTGILITGTGVPIDAVVSDFVSGAAERLSPENKLNHWDIIEGQGSLFHPAYAAVTLGLLHGSQPEAMILCHSMVRTHIDEYPDYKIPPIVDCIERYEQSAALTNPRSKVVGISVNTSEVGASARSEYLENLSDVTGLFCFDPMIDELDPLLETLVSN